MLMNRKIEHQKKREEKTFMLTLIPIVCDLWCDCWDYFIYNHGNMGIENYHDQRSLWGDPLNHSHNNTHIGKTKVNNKRKDEENEVVNTNQLLLEVSVNPCTWCRFSPRRLLVFISIFSWNCFNFFRNCSWVVPLRFLVPLRNRKWWVWPSAHFSFCLDEDDVTSTFPLSIFMLEPQLWRPIHYNGDIDISSISWLA
jgi:hypothetical protein